MKKKLMVACYVPALFGVFATFAVGASGCKKKEEEPPMPTPVAVAPLPAPVPVAIVTEEDASMPIEDAAPDVKKVVRSAPADVAGLRACCTALQQNAASMPPPNNTYALQAAQVCQSMVTAIASGSASKAGALGSIGSVMKGANLPPACK
jgi:hypothetical protein